MVGLNVGSGGINSIDGRTHVGHAAATIDITDVEEVVTLGLDDEQQSFGAGHTPPVAARIEVTNLALLQLPFGADGHFSLVVATKEVTYLVLVAGGIGVAWVEAHLILWAVVLGNQVNVVFIKNLADHLGRIVKMYHRFLRHRGIVATAIDGDDGAAKQFQVGLAKVGASERRGTGDNRLQSTLAGFDDIIAITIGRCGIVIVAIAATEELAKVDFLVVNDFCRCTFPYPCCLFFCRATDTHEGVPCFIDGDGVVRFFRNFIGHGGRADSSRYVIAAIDVVDENEVGGVFAVDIDEGASAYIGHTGTAKDPVQVAGTHGDSGIAPDIALIAAPIDAAADVYLCDGSQGQQLHQQPQQS